MISTDLISLFRARWNHRHQTYIMVCVIPLSETERYNYLIFQSQNCTDITCPSLRTQKLFRALSPVKLLFSQRQDRR